MLTLWYPMPKLGAADQKHTGAHGQALTLQFHARVYVGIQRRQPHLPACPVTVAIGLHIKQQLPPYEVWRFGIKRRLNEAANIARTGAKRDMQHRTGFGRGFRRPKPRNILRPCGHGPKQRDHHQFPHIRLRISPIIAPRPLRVNLAHCLCAEIR